MFFCPLSCVHIFYLIAGQKCRLQLQHRLSQRLVAAVSNWNTLMNHILLYIFRAGNHKLFGLISKAHAIAKHFISAPLLFPLLQAALHTQISYYLCIDRFAPDCCKRAASHRSSVKRRQNTVSFFLIK